MTKLSILRNILRHLRGSELLRIFSSALLTIVFGLTSKLIFPDSGQVIDFIRNPDRLTQISAAFSGYRERASPIALIDIDQTTFRSWGNPTHIPRQRLSEIFRIVRDGSPSAIVLDIDLTWDVEEDSLPLRVALEEAQSAAVPILLIRSLYPVSRGQKKEGLIDRKTVYDERTANLPNVRWATAFFEPEDDWTLRKWVSVHAVCSDGAPRAYPSVALATAALTDPTEGARSALGSWLKRFAEGACTLPKPVPVRRRPTEPDWVSNAADKMQIPYSLGFTENVAQFGTTTVAGKSAPLYVRLPAAALSDAGTAPDLTGRIAIIGATYEQSRDLRRTPLGTMPGMYVIANTVALARETLAENRLAGWKPVLLGMAFFLCYFLLLIAIRSVIALSVIAMLVIVLPFVSLWFGVSGHVVYEASVAALLLTGTYGAITVFLNDISKAKKKPPKGAGRVARFVLSDRSLQWWAQRSR